MPSVVENLESKGLPKAQPLVLPAKVALLAERLGLVVTLTSASVPEQYSVTRDGNPHGYIRVRWGGVSVDYPDAGDEALYEGTVDGFGGFTDHEREAELLFALGLIAARMRSA
jgi:hypothetical protein